MSRLSSNARQITYTIDRFRGVNENADVSKMKHGEATYMRNYRITDAGALKVRPGIKTEQPPFENMSGAIRGMWSGRLGGVDSLVYLQGTELYIKDQGGTHSLQGATINGTGKAEVVFFGGLLYIFTGSELYYVTSHLDSLEVVEGYVPTVSIATAPDGAGTLYESVNKLTAKRRVRYSADGTSTTYALPEECPAEIISVQVDGLFTKMYEDWSLGKITEYNFTMLSERFQTEQRELETKIRELQEALSSMEQTESDAGKWLELIKQYSNPTELTTELLNTLIEKIVVHEAVKSPDGCRKQKVDIYYRFIGKID